MKKVFDVLEQLEKCGMKRNPKIEILKEHFDCTELKRIFILAYDWMHTFGIRKYSLEEKKSLFSQRKNPGWKSSKLRWKSFKIICLALRERV